MSTKVHALGRFSWPTSGARPILGYRALSSSSKEASCSRGVGICASLPRERAIRSFSTEGRVRGRAADSELAARPLTRFLLLKHGAALSCGGEGAYGQAAIAANRARAPVS